MLAPFLERMKMNGIPIEKNLPESIVNDNPESRFTSEAMDIIGRKYLIKDAHLEPLESLKERIIRIAQTMALPEMQYGGEEAYRQWFETFYHMIAQQKFSPGGRIWSNAGTSIQQLFNCFVFPQFQDVSGVMKTLTDTAITHKEGGGTGFNFSDIPPKGMKRDGVISPGAVISMDNTDVETETICQGNRRGANMGVLDYNHPDIIDFIYAKRDRREVRDLVALEDRIVSFATNVFDAGEISYDLHTVREELLHVVRLNLVDRADVRKVDIVAISSVEFGSKLIHGEFFPVIDPFTGKEFTVEDLNVYSGNVQRNKAALGPDAINPLSVKEDEVLSNYTGRKVGVVIDGRIFMSYSLVLSELGILGVHVVNDISEFNGNRITVVKDDLESIFNSIGDSAKRYANGEASALDFSHLRAKGTPVRGGAAISSGSRSFIRNYDIASWMYHQLNLGTRDAAAISIDHPDLLDVASLMSQHWDMEKPRAFVDSVAHYIETKCSGVEMLGDLRANLMKRIRGMPKIQVREGHRLKNFNVSVFVDGEFRNALKEDGYFALKYDGKDFTKADFDEVLLNSEPARSWLGSDSEPSLKIDGKDVFETYTGRKIGIVDGEVVKLHAKTLFDMIVENAHATADPGLLFSFNANKTNQLRGESYRATNPCGEIWLYNYEPCDLGSINLAKMVTTSDNKPVLDEERLYETTLHSQRFLDNVHDANKGPIPEVEVVSKSNRRTGLGLMGWANLLAKLRLPYDSEEALELAERVGKIMYEASFNASSELALEKGQFPNFAQTTYDQTHPLRNIARLAIAPTGTISMIYDVNSAIEPFFGLVYTKWMRGGDSIKYCIKEFEEAAREEGFYSERLLQDIVANHGSVQGMNDVPEGIRRVFKVSHDVPFEWHVKTQTVFQKFMDNAVSKTINMDKSATPEDVKQAYLMAMESGLKGITVYRDGCRDEQILVV